QNFQGTARQLGIPRKTLQDWAKGQKGLPAAAERLAPVAHQKKQDLASKLDALAHQCLDLVPGKINEATLTQLMTAVGIAVDKPAKPRATPADPSTLGTVVNLTRDERRQFFIDLGQLLAPFPEAKAAVGAWLEQHLSQSEGQPEP